MGMLENYNSDSTFKWDTYKVEKYVETIIAIILIGAVIWMSYSRISNIKETFLSHLNNEPKYEYVENDNIASGQIKKIYGQNILIYNETIPQGLTEIKNIQPDSNFMYVLSDKSDVLKIKKSGYVGFYWDLLIVSIILLLIYFAFGTYYSKLIKSFNIIEDQLNKFREVFSRYNNDNGKISFEVFKENYDSIGIAISKIPYIGNIWWEFCETLIIKRAIEDKENPNEYRENNPIEKLKNTDQVEIYMNSEVIIDKQIEGRDVLEVIPGILTGIGLLGTFLAIAIALMGFDMGHIELSIQNLLGGLSIKFISSLAGIATSIIFLYTKSHLFSRLDKIIYDEQNILNSIFPRRTTESYLCHIWEEIEISNERLEDLEDYAEEQKKLSDKFIDEMGNKIEEVLKGNAQNDIKAVLDDLSKQLSNSISNNLEEPLKKLVEVMEDVRKTKEESSGKAIANVLGKIMDADKCQEAGSNITKGMTAGIDASVTKMSEQTAKVDDLVQAVGSYINQLHDYESRVESHYNNLLENLGKALNTQVDFVNKNSEYIKDIETASNKISTTSSNLDIASEKINEASAGFSQVAGNVTGIVETSNAIVINTKEINDHIAEIFSQFKENTRASMENLFSQYTKSVQNVCGDIQRTIGELEDVDFENLKESIEKLSDIVNDKYGK